MHKTWHANDRQTAQSFASPACKKGTIPFFKGLIHAVADTDIGPRPHTNTGTVASLDNPVYGWDALDGL